LVPLRLVGNRSLATAIGVILAFQSALGGAYYLFMTYLQDALGYNALQPGLAFLPLTVVSMAASLLLTGPLLARWGTHTTLFVGMLGNGIGMVLLAVGMATDAPFWTVLAGLLVWGVGAGLIGAHNNVAPYAWYLGEQAAPVATGYGVLTLEEERIGVAYNFFG
jgi:Na+/melibiose symporter-like transporter